MISMKMPRTGTQSIIKQLHRPFDEGLVFFYGDESYFIGNV
ncbi:hypothetical protein QWT69_13470 [Sporosarcina oncorhynchi]|uniref:Uncharacterized protein n=1 Tax=Sporosarcina oncorhynchi TaxID=3056444 RepID=A0ABZ0L2N1_9BACL|nr:hypothetical protein [Sporosarcina sp. T2O-4]WOV86872.1 hypothetical protein QWT69_13470 [Sporosarcina sp. T2O-4]